VVETGDADTLLVVKILIQLISLCIYLRLWNVQYCTSIGVLQKIIILTAALYSVWW